MVSLPIKGGAFALMLVASPSWAGQALVHDGGSCLDIPKPIQRNQIGAVQVAPCSGAVTQRWTMDTLGHLLNDTGACLGVNGANVQVSTACRNTPEEIWQLDAQQRLRNAGGKCLTVSPAPAGQKKDGWLQLGDCNNSPAQRWRYRYAPSKAVVNTPFGQTPAPTTPNPAQVPPASPTPHVTPATPATTPVTQTPVPAAAQSEPAPFVGLVNAHNQWRRAVGVADLRWSVTLADTASAWAKTLETQTGTQRFCGMHHSNTEHGENLAAGYQQTPAQVVERWASERADYDYASNRCAPGRVCGHYTQIVWRNTTAVGCGEAHCQDGSTVWVCQYDPPGNWMGSKPY